MARPLEFDRQETLARALQIFWNHGYKGTSMSKLVSGLGVNRASVYNTYGNKRVFFAAALEHYLNNQIPVLVAPLRSKGPVRQRLNSFFENLIELGSKSNHYRGCFVLGSLSELTQLEPELAQLCGQTLKKLEKELLKVVKEGQSSGEIRSDIEAKNLTTLLIGTLIGLMTKARTKESISSLRAAVDATFRLIC